MASRAKETGGWQGWPDICVTQRDLAFWSFCAGSLVKLMAFLNTLHWPSEVVDVGLGGFLLSNS